ncbi:MAG: TatD family hydrolase [Kiritimatiellia bacterium]
MTDAHCHVSCGDPSVRELLIGRDFIGVHPWAAGASLAGLRERLAADPRLGVGEIGLDRLKDRTISPRMREVFERQLQLALEFHRPVVLHGAKCWGQVVRAVQTLCAAGRRAPSACLFHGFSRSDGLIPDIVALNGYVSVGPAVLNDHAVNYRELVKQLPLDRLLVETDRTPEQAATVPRIQEVLAKTAELRGLTPAELERVTDANAEAFLRA